MARNDHLFLLTTILIIAVCGLVYELVTAAVASYLLGDSVTQYSLVIGVFMAAMGLGAFLTQYVRQNLFGFFFNIQILLGCFGGASALILFFSFRFDLDIRPLVIGLTLIIGTLVGMEIPLILRLIKAESSLRVSVARVLTVDYGGALLASLLFPFILLPYLGLVRSGFLFGLFNIAVALTGVLWFRKRLTRPWLQCLWAGSAFVIMGAGLVTGARLTSWLEDRLYQDDMVIAETTHYQRVVVTRWHDDVRLFLGGHLQFSSKDEYRYHESLVLPAMAVMAKKERPLRVLMLGGGDGLGLTQVLKFPAVESIDLVDLDGRILELFSNHPLLVSLNGGSLNHPKVKLHAKDAFNFLRHYQGDPYDVIFLDLPDPNGPSTNKLFTKGFFAMSLKQMTHDGVLVSQATSPFYAREAFWCIHETLRSSAKAISGDLGVFPMHAYIPSFGEWGFLMVTRQQHFDPKSLQLPFDGRFVTSDTVAGLYSFPPDLGPVKSPINTLDKPVLVSLHRQGWQRWNE